MDEITKLLKNYHEDVYAKYGATAKGVDWNDEHELLTRYDKMLGVLRKDFITLPKKLSLLDVGCGWGGLFQFTTSIDMPLEYTGVDVVESMVNDAKRMFPSAEFICEDIFNMEGESSFDFVVCNAILTQKHDISIVDMEAFSRRLVHKMFSLCKHGIAFNMMSTRVNFMVPNLYYQNPVELFSWLLTEVSPRVRIDHGYSSLANNEGKYYDYTVYVYKN